MLAEPERENLPILVDLTTAAAHALVAAARKAWPREAILVLAGQHLDGQAQIEHCIDLPNDAPGTDAFAVDPVTFARVEAELRTNGRTWLGFAHSHPNGPAYPSSTDRTNLWPHCVQLVLGLRSTGECEIGAFWLADHAVQRLPLLRASATNAEAHP
jgi:proteasome lid subunit RPN8/RPN11